MPEPIGASRLPTGPVADGPAPSPAPVEEHPGDGVRAMLDATSQLLWLIEPDGTLVEANRAALALGGLRREDVVGEDFWNSPWWAGSEETQARLRAAVKQAAQGAPVRYETDAQGAGHVATLDLTVKPVCAEAGRTLLLAEGRIITESVQARRMQAALVAAQIGTWEIDLRSGAVHRSASGDLVFGFEPDGRPRDLPDYLARIHPDDLPRVLEAIRRATEEQDEQFAEFRIVHPDGSVRWTAARGTPLLDEHGAPHRLVGAIMDVTAQRADRQASREREARLALALDAGQFATWDWFVPEDRVVWSDQMYLLYGYDVGAVEPSYELWASHIHPDDRARIEATLRRSMEGEPRYSIEFRMIPADGGPERWIEARGRFHYDEDGAPLHLTGVVGDVTERKEADAALREQAQALTTLNRVNTALAGELDLDELVQAATDAATELAGAQFGAFFYNVQDEAGESYTLYTISGVPREMFEQFPMPRNTHVFGPTFRGEGIVRSDDITEDPRYGQNVPYHGMPEGHLPVRSYLAVPVVSRSGEVHGGLFFGHERPGVFTEQSEHLVAGIAAQAAVAIDNALLYEAAQRELAERKETEEALRASEHRFRHLLLSLPAAVYTTDREGYVTLFNEQAAALWGRQPEIGKDQWCGSWRIYRPDGAPLPLDACPMAVALREERSVRGQPIVVERPDGTRAHVLPHPEPLRDASGEVVGAVNILMDLTELKRADRDRALLAAIVESSDDAVVSKTLEGIITSWNAGAERLLGYTAAEVLGQSVLILIPQDRYDEEALLLDSIRRGERVEHFETIRMTKDGRTLEVSLTVSPVRDDDGQIIGASKILRDITARKRAEAALRESEAVAQRELAERKEAEVALTRVTAESERQRRLYEAIISSTPDLVYVFDLDYRFTFVNEALLAMWGRTLEESLGKRLLAVGYEPWHAEMHEREIDQVVATKQPVRGEVPFQHATLGRRIYEYILVPVFDAEGDVEAVTGTTRDITERKEAEEALRVSEDHFRVALKHAPVVVQRLDRELRYEWVYNAHQDTPSDIIGMRAGASRPPEEAAPYVDLLQEVLETGEGTRRELTFDMPSGRVVTDLTVEPVRDENGEVVGVLTAAYDVTEIRRVETALLESEARFRAMADSAAVLIRVAGTDKLCTYVNAVWLAFTGRTMEQELGNGWTEGVHPDDLERCLDVYTSAFDAREPYEMEYRLRRHDGVYRWLLDRGTPRFAPDGTFLGCIGSCFDIHDRRQAEAHTRYLAETGTLIEQALDYEATLQQIARFAVPGFADWCAVDLLHDDGSISAIAIAHADPEKVRWGWELREREPVDPDAPTGAPNVIRTGQSELYAHIPDELLVQSARDEEHLQLMREIGFSSAIIVPMRAGGEVVGALTFVNTSAGRHFDEADLATAEELGRRAGAAIENARLHEALRTSEARFRQLAEALPDIAYTSTGVGFPDYVNARWTEYTGLSARAASYLNNPDEVIHPDDRERVAAAWAQAKEHGEPMETELRLRRYDGAYRWFLTRVVPVHDSAGRVVRWFGTSTDIHNQKAAEAELTDRVNVRTAELARSNEALDQFAYVASHDLKAPLRAIDNLAAWIAQDAGPLLPEDSKRHLSLLQGRIQRMEHLLSDLLAYSRTGREEGSAEEVDAAALVREVVEMVAPPEVEVVVETLPTLVTSRALLEMVFRNLIDNAVKHREGPSVRVHVAAGPAASDDFVTFTVADDGPGIPARYHERIFGLFQTLRPRDEVEGSGMGLAVVKKAVENVGGTIRVDSAEGQGATFTFTWPRHVNPHIT